MAGSRGKTVVRSVVSYLNWILLRLNPILPAEGQVTNQADCNPELQEPIQLGPNHRPGFHLHRLIPAPNHPNLRRPHPPPRPLHLRCPLPAAHLLQTADQHPLPAQLPQTPPPTALPLIPLPFPPTPNPPHNHPPRQTRRLIIRSTISPSGSSRLQHELSHLFDFVPHELLILSELSL